MARLYEPFYSTAKGKAYLGDSLDVMQSLADESVSLIVTSPPFPLTFQKKKPYEAVGIERYVDWFLDFGNQFRRLLKQDGSLVIDIGGVWNRGTPTRGQVQNALDNRGGDALDGERIGKISGMVR